MKSKILLLFLIIIGVGVIVLLQTKKSTFHPSGSPLREKRVQAPDFVLPDIDGNMVSLSDFKGKVVLLNIWATWCGPCVEEMPSMEKLHQEMKGEDFAVLAVSIDATGAEAVIPFMKKHNLNFTALLDPKGTIKNLYRTTGVPESFIIDQEGIIVEKAIGAKNWASPSVVGYLRKLIQRKNR